MVYESDEVKSLRPDQQRLVWLVYNGFAHDGATLTGEAKERYAAIDQELAELYTKFSNNVLHDEESYVTYITADRSEGGDSFPRRASLRQTARLETERHACIAGHGEGAGI